MIATNGNTINYNIDIMYNFDTIINDIIEIVNREERRLRALSEEMITSHLNQQHRSIKMIIGHLIDSASNNHQRMVRLQYAPRCGHSMPNTEMGMLIFPDYTQDNDLWLRLQDYQHEDWDVLLSLWRCYNLHICQIIRSVDETKLNNYWLDYEGNRVTLQDMILGYTNHLNLHIGQIHEIIKLNMH